jgi:hypothetical protein
MVPLIGIIVFYSYRHKCIDYFLCLLLIVLLPFSADSYIKAQNFKHYGVSIKNELKEKNYSRAWDAVLSLNTQSTDYNPDTKVINEEIHINLETRDKMLKISPLSKEIIDQTLDKKTGLFKHVHDKVNGTYGLWGLRDAFESAGYYQSSSLAIETYGKLADDIEAYCELDEKNCNSVLISKVQWKKGHWKKLLPTVGFVFNFTTLFPDVFLLKREELEYVTGTQDFKISSAKFFSSSPYFTDANHPITISKDYALSVIHYHDQKKWKRLKSNQERYHQIFPFLLISSLLLLIFLLYKNWREADKMFILGTLCAAFFSICAINIAIALTAYTAVARPASPATIAVIIFIPIIFGYSVQAFKPRQKSTA